MLSLVFGMMITGARLATSFGQKRTVGFGRKGTALPSVLVMCLSGGSIRHVLKNRRLEEELAVKPSQAPGACKHLDDHVTHLGAGCWRDECLKCGAKWTSPIMEHDADLITAMRGGKPLLKLVK